MKIFRTKPDDSTQWRSDSPSVKAMRVVLPIAALLSAVSLAGGLSSFLELNLVNKWHIAITVAFVVGAFYFDALGISSGRAVVRDFILSARGEIDRGVLFWISSSLAAVIAITVVLASFTASRNGIAHLVLEYRQAQELTTEVDSTLTTTVDQAQGSNAAIIEAKRQTYEAERTAIVTTYDARIEAVNVDIDKRRRQRTNENRQWIDNKISSLQKRAAELEAEKGVQLAALARAFSEDQARLLAESERLQDVVVTDAQEASQRRKKKQTEKDQADKQLSGLVSGIFSWSVVLMMVIGLRLELLEVRNNILPNPILSNGDLSGLEDVRRFIMSVPYFLFSWIHYASEKLYEFAAKRQPPTVDNDLVNYQASQIEVKAIRKEGKVRRLPDRQIERRAIGYNQSGKPGTEAKNDLDPLCANFEPSSDQDPDVDRKAIIEQIKLTKRELRKYKKRQSSSYQTILAAKRKGEEPKQQTVQAYENRTEWVQRLEAELHTLESKLNSLN